MRKDDFQQIKKMIREILMDLMVDFELQPESYQDEKYLKVQEVSQYLSLGESTVRNLLKDGKLPYHRIGDSIRIKRSELDDYLKSTHIASEEE